MCELKQKYGPAICPGCPHYKDGECKKDEFSVDDLAAIMGMK